MNRKVGTAYYVSPEVLKGDYNQLCDVWSAGVILYILLSGDPPFNGRNDNEIYDKIYKGKYTFPDSKFKNVSQEAKDLISKMLCPQKDRLSAEECLNDKWFEVAEEKEVKLEIDVSNLTKYVKSNKLKKAVLTFIADRLNEDQIGHLKETFLALDKDHNGTLSYDEIKDGLKEFKLPEEEFQKIFKKADTDASGCIDYTEFIASAINVKKDIREVYLQEAFQKFDLDGSGKISKDELMKILKIEEGDKKAESIAKMMDKIDINKDGEIDYNEFVKMITDED